MALITVNLRLVSPQGTSDVPAPATGRVDFIPAAHGKYHNSLRTVEKVTSQIDAEGEMIPVELTPTLWKVTITPTKGNPWPEMLFELTEGMPEPVNLADLLPETVVDGVQLAKGDPGPVGPQGEPGPEGPQGPQGEQGTTAWDDLTGKPTSFPTAVADVDGLVVDTTTGTRVSVGGVDVFYDSGWRDISGLINPDYLQANPNATAHIIRVGKTVTFNFYQGMDATYSGVLGEALLLPEGFKCGNLATRPWGSPGLDMQTGKQVTDGAGIYIDTSGQRVSTFAVPGKRYAFTMHYVTPDPIPTTLPGDPA